MWPGVIFLQSSQQWLSAVAVPRWESTLSDLLSTAGCRQLFEIGPGSQIKAMVRRIDQAAWKDFVNVKAG
jgi:hypothetical protein